MLRNAKLAERIAELQNRVSERAEVKIVEVVGTLTTVLRANMLDYVQIGPDGLPYADWRGLTREQAAVISEVTVDSRMESADEGHDDRRQVTKVRFKLHDKLVRRTSSCATSAAKVVLDRPVASHGAGEGFGREGARGDVGSSFGFDLVSSLDAAFQRACNH